MLKTRRHPPKNKHCLFCKKPFLQPRSNKLYCNAKCRYLAFTEKEEEERKRGPSPEEDL